MSTHRFQPPKGTRDFYPADMARRRHLESVWRTASINHGFEEVEGPTFEHLDLYTVKSGQEIVSQLFSFQRAGGEVDYALRPEFTPTLARMVAARVAQLPKPIKWFTIPANFRAERPQRGRLREFLQWNVDLVGESGAGADAEVIATAVSALASTGLAPDQVQVRLSHRHAAGRILGGLGVDADRLPAAFDLLDRRDKMDPKAFSDGAAELGLTAGAVDRFDRIARTKLPLSEPIDRLAEQVEIPPADLDELAELRRELAALELIPWCSYDLGIVRGLAYYTGMVFEVHDVAGAERAIAGGGRYDQLVELFGGPPTPAVGFAMGDVVIGLVLEEHGLLESPEQYLPAPDVFVISTGTDASEALRPGLVMRLRRAGLHVRHSYRATRNVGKLLGEAGKLRARRAVILGSELEASMVTVKDLQSGEQQVVPLADLERILGGPS